MKKDEPWAIQFVNIMSHIDQVFKFSAKHYHDNAAAYEETGLFESAVFNYQKAAEWYQIEKSIKMATNCRLKVANLLSLHADDAADYKRAIEIFEDVALNYLTCEIPISTAKEYIVRAGICYVINNDFVGARRLIRKFIELDSEFEPSFEYQLVYRLAEYCEAKDIKSFTDDILSLKSMKETSDWLTIMILRIYNQLKSS